MSCKVHPSIITINPKELREVQKIHELGKRYWVRCRPKHAVSHYFVMQFRIDLSSCSVLYKGDAVKVLSDKITQSFYLKLEESMQASGFSLLAGINYYQARSSGFFSNQLCSLYECLLFCSRRKICYVTRKRRNRQMCSAVDTIFVIPTQEYVSHTWWCSVIS